MKNSPKLTSNTRLPANHTPTHLHTHTHIAPHPPTKLPHFFGVHAFMPKCVGRYNEMPVRPIAMDSLTLTHIHTYAVRVCVCVCGKYVFIIDENCAQRGNSAYYFEYTQTCITGTRQPTTKKPIHNSCIL